MQDFESREELRLYFAKNYDESPEDLIRRTAGFIDGDVIEHGWWGLERAIDESDPQDDSGMFLLNCEDWVYKYIGRYSEEISRGY